MIVSYKGLTPDVSKAAFVAENATVVGDAVVGAGSSVWFGAVIRADIAPISIGEESNVQDNATLHVDYGLPAVIGDRVTIGHNAIVHGAVIEDDVLIGMHATVLNGARVGKGSIIAAGALVKEHEVIPAGSLVVGVPGRVVRTLEAEDIRRVRKNAADYVEESAAYVRGSVEC